MNKGIQKKPTHNVTFMFPFVLKTPVKAPKEKSGWHKVPKSGNGENEFELRYFFTPEARELLFDAQNKQKGQAFYALPENGAYYRIKKNETEYAVAAKYIHMMRLDNGVGILTIKTETEESEKLEIITQLGRKIYPTSLCENDEETADSLELLGTNVEFEVWRKELRKHEKEEEPEERRRKKLHPDEDFIAAPFLELIKRFSGERNTVTPILGDKMFVSHTYDYVDAEVIALRKEIEVQERQNDNVEKFIETAKRYVGIDTVEPYALRELVQAIYVEKPDKSSGTRQQKIRIKYNGVGFIPLEELMKKAAA